MFTMIIQEVHNYYSITFVSYEKTNVWIIKKLIIGNIGEQAIIILCKKYLKVCRRIPCYLLKIFELHYL